MPPSTNAPRGDDAVDRLAGDRRAGHQPEMLGLCADPVQTRTVSPARAGRHRRHSKRLRGARPIVLEASGRLLAFGGAAGRDRWRGTRRMRPAVIRLRSVRSPRRPCCRRTPAPVARCILNGCTDREHARSPSIPGPEPSSGPSRSPRPRPGALHPLARSPRRGGGQGREPDRGVARPGARPPSKLAAARQAIAALGITVHQSNETIGVDASRLRQRHSISLPEADCLATAKHTPSTLSSFDEQIVRAARREGVTIP